MSLQKVRTVFNYVRKHPLITLLALLSGSWVLRSYKQLKASKRKKIVLKLNLSIPIVDTLTPGFPFVPKPRVFHLKQILDVLDVAASDPRVLGLVGVISQQSISDLHLGHAQELHDAITVWRERTKKPTHFYAESFDENKVYYLATAFEKISMQPTGLLRLSSLILESPFCKQGFDKWGVSVKVTKRGSHKTAPNVFTEKGFTPEHREQFQSILNSWHDQLCAGIANARKMTSPEEVAKHFSEGPFLGHEAVERGLVDILEYFDEFVARVRSFLGVQNVEFLSLKKYLSDSYTRQLLRKRRREMSHFNEVALVYASDIIQKHLDPRRPSHTMPLVPKALKEISQKPNVKAIILRVDSPGGTTTMSDTIWRWVRVNQNLGKKVYISLGNVAASGGYYIASPGDLIIAQPGTLTGSIGVFNAWISAKKFLEEQIGITSEYVATSDNVPGSFFHEVSPAYYERCNQMVDQLYLQFKQRVAEGRRMDIEHVESLAQGRVYTGQQALALGLVDRLGGLTTAIELAKKEFGPVKIVEYPPKKSLFSELTKLFHSLPGNRNASTSLEHFVDMVNTYFFASPISPLFYPVAAALWHEQLVWMSPLWSDSLHLQDLSQPKTLFLYKGPSLSGGGPQPVPPMIFEHKSFVDATQNEIFQTTPDEINQTKIRN